MIDAAIDAIARIPVAAPTDLIDRDPQAPAEQHGEAQPNRESDDGDRPHSILVRTVRHSEPGRNGGSVIDIRSVSPSSSVV